MIAIPPKWWLDKHAKYADARREYLAPSRVKARSSRTTKQVRVGGFYVSRQLTDSEHRKLVNR